MKKKLYLGLGSLVVAVICARTGFFALLFTPKFPVRHNVYAAQPALMWTNVVLDGLISASYALILVCLVWFIRRMRREPELAGYSWIFTSFATFIFACGLSRLTAMATVWFPIYWLSLTVKLVCVSASVPTALIIYRSTPVVARNMHRFLSSATTNQLARGDAEAKLLASEKRLRLTLNSASGVGTWEYDIASATLRTDAKVAEFYGLDVEAAARGVPSENVSRYIHPDDRHLRTEAIAASVRDGSSFAVEYRLLVPDQPLRWLAVKGHCSYAPDGTPVSFSGLVIDVTERRISEQKLQISEEQLRLSLIASNGVGIWECNIATTITRADAKVAEFYGVDPLLAEQGTEIANFYRYMHPDDRPWVTKAIEATLTQGAPFACEYRIAVPGVPVRWVGVKGHCTYAPDGSPLLFTGLVIDVTQRRSNEEKLRVSEEKLALTRLSANRMGMWDWDLVADIFRSDAMVAEFHGVDASVALAGTNRELYFANIHADDRPMVEQAVARSLQDGVPAAFTYRVLLPGKPLLWLALQGNCTFGPDGAPTTFVGIVMDVTERKRNEEMLRLAEIQKRKAMEELATRDGQFRLLVEGIRDCALFTVDEQGSITSWNLGAERLLGHREKFILGRNLSAIFTPDDVANGVPKALMRKAAETGRAEDEGWRVRADGSRFWANVNKTALVEDNGQSRGFAIVIQDITDRRKVMEARDEAEAKVREGEQKWKLAFLGVNGVGTWEWDLRTNLIFSNETFAQFYGIDPVTASTGASFSQFAANIPAEDIAPMTELVTTAIRTGQPYVMEHRVIQSDGEVRWVEARAQVTYSADGQPERFPGVVLDITDRRHREQSLLRAQGERHEAIEALEITTRVADFQRVQAASVLAERDGQFRLLVEGVRDHAMFTVGPTGAITSWNLGAQRLLGYREEDILGRDFFSGFMPEDAEADAGKSEQPVGDGSEAARAEDEGWRVKADGTRFWANVSKTPFFDENGQVRGFAIVIQDTTEKKKVATALDDARQERARLQERFLSHVSHELRTPLTAIYFFTSNVADGLFGALTTEQSEHLGFALQNIKQLKEMVEDLLDITRVGSPRLTVEPHRTQADRLVAQVLQTCLTNARAKQITLVPQLAGDLPPVWADALRVRQILINLIDNAIKFSPEGERITVAADVDTADENMLRFSVADRGCGISGEHKERIFDRLAQVETRSEASRSGLGLGLFIARELVGQHGGVIWVESEVGLGSTFFFTLPVFSLNRLCAHLFTEDNLVLGCVTLIRVVLAGPQGSTRKDLLPRVQRILERCIHPARDILLPSMGDEVPGMTFFILACTDHKGAGIIAGRIDTELRNFDPSSRLRPAISSTTLPTPNSALAENQIADFMTRFEGLIQAQIEEQEKVV